MPNYKYKENEYKYTQNIYNFLKIFRKSPPGIKRSWRRHNDVFSVRPSDITGTSQMKHPTMSRWNVAKTTQWYASPTCYWNVVTTSQKDVTTTSHQRIFMTSQTSLKWNTQRRLSGTLPRRLSGTYPRRPISTSLRRLLEVPNKTPNNVVVVLLHHVSELLFHDVMLVGL